MDSSKLKLHKSAGQILQKSFHFNRLSSWNSNLRLFLLQLANIKLLFNSMTVQMT